MSRIVRDNPRLRFDPVRPKRDSRTKFPKVASGNLVAEGAPSRFSHPLQSSGGGLSSDPALSRLRPHDSIEAICEVIPIVAVMVAEGRIELPTCGL